MLQIHRYTIFVDPTQPKSVLYFSQLGARAGDGTDVLGTAQSVEPEALGKLSRIMAFYALLDAELYDRAALGDFESETLTTDQIRAQVEKMLTEPEVLEAIKNCSEEVK